MALRRIAYLLMAGAILSACANTAAPRRGAMPIPPPRPAPAAVSLPEPAMPPASKSATGAESEVVAQEGEASYYHDAFEGRRTASGEPFSQNRLTAASPDLPLGAKATVINQETGETVEVKITDRGPYVDGRVIDLSKKAAERIGIDEEGVAPVRVEARPEQQPTEELKEAVEAQTEAQ